MNKIKLLYDVVKTMRSKEVLNGILTVKVHKAEVNLFSLRNEFEKNLLTGQTKAKIDTTLDYEGKMVKHESNTEFTMPHSGGCRCHEIFQHLHKSHATCCGGRLKDKFSRLLFALGVLNALQTEEQADKTILISLNANDLPEDVKLLLREKMNQASECHHHNHGFLKEFCAADSLDFVVNIFTNKNYEVEKIVITLVGTQKDEHNAPYDLTARAEVSFVW